MQPQAARDEILEAMSETPKFEVIDRRKIKAEEEKESAQTAAQKPAQPAPPAPAEPPLGPRLVVNEGRREAAAQQPAQTLEEAELADALTAAPTAEESHEQKAAYDASAQRLEDLIRAQNPAAGPQPPVGFDHLVQQLYLTAMLQMGAGAQEGERPRVDIMGARTTIDLLGILAEKTRGNLTNAEDRMLQTVLFETRMAFLELTSMMTVPNVPPPPPAAKK
jgi:type IV secretory pathway VirB10-like protein